MPQSMPEALDYRNLVGKLARLDSEWESLKGMLTFKTPYKDDEPAKSSVASGASPMDTATNVVVGFRGQAAAARGRTGGARTPGPMAVTPRELEAITDKIAITRKDEENDQDKALMGRLMTVERQIHKLTVLVTAFTVLAIALVAALTFLGIRGNLVYGANFHQPQVAAAAQPGSPEAVPPAIDRQAVAAAPVVPAPDRQLPGPTATIPPAEAQPVSAAAQPGETANQVAEVKTAPAAAEPAPRFVGSLTSNKIHTPDCKWAAKISAKNLIAFPSLAAGRERGYIPCPVCRPHEVD
jgi:hypothetical protein